MKSAIKIFLSLHTQISKAEKLMRREKTKRKNLNSKKNKTGYLEAFGFKELDKDLIGGPESLPADACILLKGERGTHKLAFATNYLFQGLRKGENVVLFNMGAPVRIDKIPQFKDEPCKIKDSNGSCSGGRIEFNENLSYQKLLKKNPNGLKKTDAEQNQEKNLAYYPYKLSNKDNSQTRESPPVGKYKLHWWVSNKDFSKNSKKEEGVSALLKNHGNLFILDFDAGYLFPEEFISTLTEFWGWIDRLAPRNSKGKRNFFPFTRVLLNSTAQINTQFPILAEEQFLIPSFIRLAKCYGISSMIIDVLPPGGEQSKNSLNFDALSDLIITIKHNFDKKYSAKGALSEGVKEDAMKIMTADNITGKVYSKNWLGFWISKNDLISIFNFVDAEKSKDIEKLQPKRKLLSRRGSKSIIRR